MGKRKSDSSEKGKKERETKDVNTVMELDSQDLSLEALGCYDVFLNHRGPDVKGSFVSHLYELLRVRGCNPFLDAKSLIKGNHALNSINEALHGVRVHLAIFSTGYAESKYCLNELFDMMQSPEKVIPVFFQGVEPKHLRWIESGPFAKAFEKHLQKKRDKDVERWKNALLEASHLTGFRRSQYTDDFALLEDIVARVLEAFGPAELHHARYPVGLEQSSKGVLDILNQMGDTTGVVGITGTGGIGKTTLATHVYNAQNNFTCRSFLKDVKHAKMANLKEKMVWDLLQEDMRKIGGFERCFEQIKSKKIFVVIDDLVERSQFDELIPSINNLGGGSRVLITSRDQNLLNNIMRDVGEKKLYVMQVLGPSDSLQLFMKAAFHNDIPSARLHDLSCRVAQACGGLPLALEVSGQFLFDKRDERLWNETITMLDKNKNVLDPVGLEQPLEVVLDILNQMGNTAGVVGITGMGGIGKTTLATHVYNAQNNFTCRSILKDVKDANMAYLKEKMVWDLLQEDMRKIGGFERCFEQIKSKKIFVVIDDIVERSQFDELIPSINNLGGGSRVLITSRDQNLLNNIMRDVGEKKLYVMQVLSSSDSLQLFMKTAFHDDIPCARLRDLSYRIANACGGLPLALEVIGRFLFDKDGDERLWNEAITTLHKNKDILDCLKLSYNSLDEVEQIMFLDIAFFLVGAPKDAALDFWNSDDLFSFAAATPLCTLIDKCLLEVDENGFLTMHDLLRVMGRDVVVKKSPRNEGKQSHLCNPSSVIKVLEQNKDTEKVRGLTTSGIQERRNGNEAIWQAEHFASLNELQILILEDCDVEGDFSKWSRELRWLKWRHMNLIELPQDLQLPNLIVLDLAYNNHLYCIWPKDFGMQIPFPRLHILNLHGCCNLRELPIFIGGLIKLRVLNISYSGVKVLPEDFGKLQSLQDFDASHCSALSRLPNSFGQLSNLETLNLSGCGQLQSLLVSMSGLTKLKVLNISNSGVQALPEDFGEQQSLGDFNASGCLTLSRLPNSFGQLQNLETLNLSGCGQLQSLPISMGGLTNLRVINISYTRVQELPEDFGELQSLQDFDANGCSSLSRLPSSLGQLPNLDTLDLSRCGQLQSLPVSMRGLTKLRVLNISYTKVQALPEDFGELQSLGDLNASGCSTLSRLPNSLGELPNLETLNLSGCDQLQSIPISMGGLRKLRVLKLLY